MSGIAREEEAGSTRHVVAAPAAPDPVRTERLLRAARRGNRRAREQLVRSRLGLVRAIAARYRNLGLPLDDLVQEGSLGLLEAIDHYDPDRGADLDSYARFRIRRAIRKALSEHARLIRLPQHILEHRRAIERAEAALISAADGGRAPTPAQLAAATGLPLAAVLEARAAPLAPISLDEPVLDDGAPLEALVADPTAPDPERETLEHEQTELVRSALATLPERQQRIVRRRWGIDGPPHSPATLAREFELSKRRTQTLARDALFALRAALEPAGRP